jgi:choline-sulfatase
MRRCGVPWKPSGISTTKIEKPLDAVTSTGIVRNHLDLSDPQPHPYNDHVSTGLPRFQNTFTTALWHIARAAIVLFVALLPGLVPCSASTAEPPQPPSILLLTVDTLRADALAAYGANDAKTPNLDKLAAEGILFERAATPMPLTRPAHFSIFTSLYPREHGVINNSLSLPQEAETLAEKLREAGYHTGAFVAVSLLSEEAGAAQGFEAFRGVGPDRYHRNAKKVVTEALDWLRLQPKNAPFFLWVHLFDPHLPYRPPKMFQRGLDPQMAHELPGLNWERLIRIARSNDGDIPAKVLQHALSLYRSEVEYTDHWVGKLLTGIQALRGNENTLVAFAADHGECFDHGVYFEHADCLFEGAIQIPMIIRHPESFPAGKRWAGQVTSLDIAPTLLKAAGVKIPAAFSGLPIQDLSEDDERYVLLQYPFYETEDAKQRVLKLQVIQSVAGEKLVPTVLDQEMVGVVGGHWKYLRSQQTQQLYDHQADPEEREDVSQARPKAREELNGHLDSLLRQHSLTVLDSQQINPALRATLEALGYLAPVKEAPQPTVIENPLPSP